MKISTLLSVLVLCVACDRGERQVTVYVSLDDVFSRPILDAFQAETGIRVLPVLDVEADKTTGLYKRLVREHESGRPRADVFWNSEVARTIQLHERGVLAPYDSPSATDIPPAFRTATWSGFAARARVLIYNTERVPETQKPTSIWDLTQERFRGEVAVALPLYGTTATHAGALWARLGREGGETYFRRLRANEVRVVAGNSTVRDRVASGELKVGLTDTDDAYVALQKGLPIGIVFPDQEATYPGLDEPLGTFVIPNTVALIAGGPDPDAGRRFIDFVLRREVEARLARAESAQIPLRPGIDPPDIPGMPRDLVRTEVSYADVARGVAEARDVLEQLFVR